MGEEYLPRSSADRDHPLREMLRRSPRPPEVGEEGEEGEGNELDISRDPGGRIDKSRTDLQKYIRFGAIQDKCITHLAALDERRESD